MSAVIDKENAPPNMRRASMAGPPTKSILKPAPVLSIHDEFRGKIESYQGDNPLLPWIDYVRYLQSNNDERLHEVIVECLNRFSVDDRYHDDNYFVKMWIMHADLSPNPSEVLEDMRQRQLGQKHSIFYTALGCLMEMQGDWKAADQIYVQGFMVRAEPADSLVASYNSFKERWLAHQAAVAKSQRTEVINVKELRGGRNKRKSILPNEELFEAKKGRSKSPVPSQPQATPAASSSSSSDDCKPGYCPEAISLHGEEISFEEYRAYCLLQRMEREREAERQRQIQQQQQQQQQRAHQHQAVRTPRADGERVHALQDFFTSPAHVPSFRKGATPSPTVHTKAAIRDIESMFNDSPYRTTSSFPKSPAAAASPSLQQSFATFQTTTLTKELGGLSSPAPVVGRGRGRFSPVPAPSFSVFTDEDLRTKPIQFMDENQAPAPAPQPNPTIAAAAPASSSFAVFSDFQDDDDVENRPPPAMMNKAAEPEPKRGLRPSARQLSVQPSSLPPRPVAEGNRDHHIHHDINEDEDDDDEENRSERAMNMMTPGGPFARFSSASQNYLTPILESSMDSERMSLSSASSVSSVRSMPRTASPVPLPRSSAPLRVVDPYEIELLQHQMAHVVAQGIDGLVDSSSATFPTEELGSGSLSELDIGDNFYTVSQLLKTRAVGEQKFGFVQAMLCNVDAVSPEEEHVLITVADTSLWSHYVSTKLKACLPATQQRLFVLSSQAHLFANAAAAMTLGQEQTLQNIMNKYKQAKTAMDETLVLWYGVEMLRVLEHMHGAGFLHGALNAESLIINTSASGSEDEELDAWTPERKGAWQNKGLRLSAFDRSIERSMHCGAGADSIAHTRFLSKNMEQSPLTTLLQEPWAEEIDTAGVCAVVHELLFGSVMTLKKTNDKWSTTTPFKSHWQVEVWTQFFDVLLNINNPAAVPLIHELSTQSSASSSSFTTPAMCAVRGLREYLEKVLCQGQRGKELKMLLLKQNVM